MRLLFVFGTRPEAIKLAPLIRQSQSDDRFEPLVCATAQHRGLLDQVMDLFGIAPDYDLDLMREGQSPAEFSARALSAISEVIAETAPSVVVVQGDTSTVLMGGLAAFYARVRIAHVEAGLRTHDLAHPFPEEGNRAMVSRIAHYHFAPTDRARQNLASEGITESVYVVGNTVVDALKLGGDIVARSGQNQLSERFPYLNEAHSVVLVTLHRRESFDRGLAAICAGIATLARERSDLVFVFPVHPNPAVQRPVREILRGLPNVKLESPFAYAEMIHVMSQSRFVLTDSGGIQEEAPSLGKPVLVARTTTERPEGIAAGVARLVGTETEAVVSACRELLDSEEAYQRMSRPQNPYGDGLASARILDALSGATIAEFAPKTH